jgi:hypothetical protein
MFIFFQSLLGKNNLAFIRTRPALNANSVNILNTFVYIKAAAKIMPLVIDWENGRVVE